MPLTPFVRELEESAVALAVGSTVTAFLYLVFGLAGGSGEQATVLRVVVSLPFYLGVMLAAVSLFQLVMLAPWALLLRLLGIALEGVERAAVRVFGAGARVERRPFTYAALLVALEAGLVAAAVAAAEWWSR